jgi:hypothetical protein
MDQRDSKVLPPPSAGVEGEAAALEVQVVAAAAAEGDTGVEKSKKAKGKKDDAGLKNYFVSFVSV